MYTHNFIWCDLSTFDLNTAKTFYNQIFDWEYDNGDYDYYTAYTNQKEVSGLYLMPEKYVQMEMPSFWMSYIQVQNVEDTVKKAQELGGKIELKEDDPHFGKIALIRDPSGAGFTIYESDQQSTEAISENGSMYWNELYISNAELVLDFYKDLFGWDIREEPSNNRYNVFDEAGNQITAIQQVSNADKGDHEYWGIYFAVDNLQKAKKLIKEHGGDIHYEDTYGIVASDPMGAVFHCTEAR